MSAFDFDEVHMVDDIKHKGNSQAFREEKVTRLRSLWA